MSDEHPTDLLGALPRTRPHRRSDKRPARAAAAPQPKRGASPRKTTAAAPRKQTAAARATGTGSRRAKPPARKQAERAPQAAEPAGEVRIVATAVQAAAEIAEIGLSLGARALRSAVGRLPRP